MKPSSARNPTLPELNALFDYVWEQQGFVTENGEEFEQLWGTIADAGIAVIDSYITDSPGYAGRILIAVWPAGPSVHDILSFEQDGSLTLEGCNG